MFEIKLTIPDGFRLVGTRTDGGQVVVVFEPIPYEEPAPAPEPRRKIGFVRD